MKDTTNPTRRRFLAGATTVAGGAIVSRVASAEPELPRDAIRPDPTSVQGAAVGSLGARSEFEVIQRAPAYGIISLTPLQKLHGTITPADLHFERHHAGIPAINPAEHYLLIHGLVDRPLKFSVEELKRFPSVTRTHFIECSGNLSTIATEKTTVQALCGLTSQSEWTGVAVSTLLREAGLKSKASWCLAEGSDAAVMTRSIPVEKLLDDAVIAYAQNGEAIRPAQGYPIRLLLPGWEGNTHIKWLRRLEFSDSPFMTREETSKYTDTLGNNTARQFSVVMDARTVITNPTYPSIIEPGWQEIRGLAWSGRGKITSVEVSTDGGRSWQQAQLQGPVLSKAHTRFGLMWNWNGQATEIASRARDESGYLQPTQKQLLDARGGGKHMYHLNPIVHWLVKRDGRVTYKPQMWA